jgi:hypothetical protein
MAEEVRIEVEPIKEAPKEEASEQASVDLNLGVMLGELAARVEGLEATVLALSDKLEEMRGRDDGNRVREEEASAALSRLNDTVVEQQALLSAVLAFLAEEDDEPEKPDVPVVETEIATIPEIPPAPPKKSWDFFQNQKRR